MACGLKKQNNNEGGVHLTERTCSPYNPIIKLIVDDCLGLPIYPVSSIDAVIDEEGNTLRLLLNKLLDDVNSGNFSVEDIKSRLLSLESSINGLDETYVSKDLFELLKTLVWAISAIESLSNITPNTPDTIIKNNETNTPKIVEAVKNLLHDLQEIIGGDGNSLSLASLKDMIDSLELLLKAVASFDVGYRSEDSNLTTNEGVIKIIQEILDIKTTLGLDDPLSGEEPPTGGSIILRIDWLIELVLDLIELVSNLENNSAHLDPRVLELKKEGFNIENYLTLKLSEYPPTTIAFATNDNVPISGLVYFGLLNDKVPIGNYEKIKGLVPFGRTENTGGHQLYYNDGTPLMYNNLPLYAGSGKIGGADILKECEIIFNKKVVFEQTPTNLTEEQLENISYKDIYMSIGTTIVQVGNFAYEGNDDRVNIADLERLVLAYRGGSVLTNLNSNYSPNLDTGWIVNFISESEGRNDAIFYPCIPGKLYTDYLTGKLYRYKAGKMLPVSKLNIIGGSGITVESGFNYIDEENLSAELLGPYEEIIIKANQYEADKGLNITDSPNNTKTISVDTSNFPIEDIINTNSEDPLQSLTLNKVYNSENDKVYSEITLGIPNIIVNLSRDVALVGEYYYANETITNIIPTFMQEKSTPSLNNQKYKLSISDLTGLISIIFDFNKGKSLTSLISSTKSYIEDRNVTIDLWERIDSNIESWEDFWNYVLPTIEGAEDFSEIQTLVERWVVVIETDAFGLAILKNYFEELKKYLDLYNKYGDVILTEGQNHLLVWYLDSSDNMIKSTTVIGKDIILNIIYKILQTIFPDEDNISLDSSFLLKLSRKIMEQNALSIIGEAIPIKKGIYKKSDNITDDIYIKPAVSNQKIFKFEEFDSGELKYKFKYLDYDLTFAPLVPEYTLSFYQGTLQLISDSGAISTVNLATSSSQIVQSPIFFGDYSENINPLTSEAISLSIAGGNTIYKLEGPLTLLGPNLNGINYNLLDVADNFQVFADEENLQLRNICPFVVNMNNATSLIEQIISNLSSSELENFNLNDYTYSYTVSSLDVPNGSMKEATLIVFFKKIDPDGAITMENLGVNLTIEITKDEHLSESITYYVSDVGTYIRFTGENLEPSIVNVESKLAPVSRITSDNGATTCIVYPNEYLEIPACSTLTFDLLELAYTPGYRMIKVQGQFVGTDNMDIDFIVPSNVQEPTQSSSNPTIASNTVYKYELFNNVFSFKAI